MFAQPSDITDNLKRQALQEDVERLNSFSPYLEQVLGILANEFSTSSDAQLQISKIQNVDGLFDLSDFPNTVFMQDLNANADDSPEGSILKGNEFRKVLRAVAIEKDLDYLDLYDAFAPFFALDLDSKHNNTYLFLDPRN